MCNTKPCDNCCHEEDLLCCMPIKHCCGGYSEHNNCCPHDRCCNQCCGGCGCCCCCPFTPECCCCKLMKLAKKNQEDIKKLNSDIDELHDNLDDEIERATTAEGDLAEAIDAERERLDREILRATNRENEIERALEREIERATNVEDNELVASAEYDPAREYLYFKNKKGITISDINLHPYYWNITTATQKLSELEEKVTKPLSWSGLSTGSYNGKAPASFKIPNGTASASSGYALSSVSINQTTGALSGTSIKVPTADDLASSLNGSIPAESGKAVASVTISNGVLSGTTVDLPSTPSNLINLINIGSTPYTPSDGVVTLPEYPTPSSIDDLDEIRRGARLGATSLLPGDAFDGASQNGNVITFTKNGGSPFTFTLPSSVGEQPITVNVDGSSVTMTIAQAILDIYNKLLWKIDSSDSSMIVAKSNRKAAASAFYDTSVN